MNDQIIALHKPYCVMDVANYLIQHFIYKNHPINNELLNKLLYYVQADSLLQTDKPLFSEIIYKWGHGPIVPEVYSYLKSNGAAPITSTMEYVVFNSDNSWTLIKPNNRVLALPDTLRIDPLANEIYSKFYKDSFKLVKQTLKEAIWQKDRVLIEHDIMDIPYTNDEIKNYFSKPGNWVWEN